MVSFSLVGVASSSLVGMVIGMVNSLREPLDLRRGGGESSLPGTRTGADIT